ncbi:MAG: hypothetical protein L0099_15030 [Acidobacteria bacterium]|nr:hypothetical protein [Acidobacteriota bacterium]
MAEKRDLVAQKLDTLVRKVKLFSTEGRDEVGCKIYAPQAHGNPYIIEISRERFVRRVSVDVKTAQNLNLGRPDPALMRELRTAIVAVTRFAQRRT